MVNKFSRLSLRYLNLIFKRTFSAEAGAKIGRVFFTTKYYSVFNGQSYPHTGHMNLICTFTYLSCLIATNDRLQNKHTGPGLRLTPPTSQRLVNMHRGIHLLHLRFDQLKFRLQGVTLGHEDLHVVGAGGFEQTVGNIY